MSQLISISLNVMGSKQDKETPGFSQSLQNTHNTYSSDVSWIDLGMLHGDDFQKKVTKDNKSLGQWIWERR